MADQLYLSYWLNSIGIRETLREYEKMVRLFPYSQLSKSDATFRVIPVSYSEPAIVEQAFKKPVDPAQVNAAAKEFQHPDSCYRLETWWDLWQYDGEWKLRPAPVALCAFGPKFEREFGENLRLEFGIDTHFLPQPDLPGHSKMTASNIKSLLHLVHEIDDAVSAQRRQLWTDSGENFAGKLQMMLTETRQ